MSVMYKNCKSMRGEKREMFFTMCFLHPSVVASENAKYRYYDD